MFLPYRIIAVVIFSIFLFMVLTWPVKPSRYADFWHKGTKQFKIKAKFQNNEVVHYWVEEKILIYYFLPIWMKHSHINGKKLTFLTKDDYLKYIDNVIKSRKEQKDIIRFSEIEKIDCSQNNATINSK